MAEHVLVRSNERGKTKLAWLDSKHSFSLGDYYDPDHMQFGALRVINDDLVAPGAGFGEHPHRDMEIVTYVLSGALEHRDSMGNGSVITPGKVQRMTAGKGIFHSEFNHSKTEPVRLLQIWIVPAQRGLAPGYEEKEIVIDGTGKLNLIVSDQPTENALKIHQDVKVFSGKFSTGDRTEYKIESDRRLWIQVASGKLIVNDLELNEGDGLGLSEVQALCIEARAQSEILVFDLADQ